MDPFDEQLIPLSQCAKLLPRGVHVSTLHRWRVRGIRGVRLAATAIGGKFYSSREAVDRFLAATNASQEWPRRSQPRDSQRATRTERLLDEAGF